MRAVNLIPADARSGGGAGLAGRSGGAAYLLLGGLATLVAMAALWAMTTSGIAGKRAEVAQLDQDIARLAARAEGSASPGDVQAVRVARTAAVRALVSARVDWAATLDAIGRTLPADTTLDTLDASAAGPPTDTAGAAAQPAGAALGAGPVVQIGGCAPSQRAVAALMPRLRTIPGVGSVQLVSSVVDPGSPGGSGGAATSTEPCRGATFQMALAFAPAAGAAAVAATTPPATAATTPPPATATTAVAGTPTPGAGQ